MTVHFTTMLKVYKGRYLEFVFHTTTVGRALWLTKTLKTVWCSRAYRFVANASKLRQTKSTLALGIFCRHGKKVRSVYFTNVQLARLVGEVWSQGKRQAFTTIDFHKRWVKQHQEIYEPKGKQAARAPRCGGISSR